MNDKPESERKTAPPPSPPEKSLPPPKRRRFKLSYIIAAVVLLILIAAGIFYYIRFMQPFESTDDAFIEGYVTFISPRVSGPVIHLLVTDNQHVKAGDPLVEIDPSDFQTELAQAQADLKASQGRLDQAQAQLSVDQAKVEQQKASVIAAEAVAQRAVADEARYEAVKTPAVSRSQRDVAKAESSTSQANVTVAHSQVKAAEAQLEADKTAVITASAQVKQAEARLHQAELNLSYTHVVAPRDGRVARRTVEQGAFVQRAQNLLAIVPDDVWVVANFKETQLKEMRAGQAVRIRIDAYPNRDFSGKVDSFQRGTGARFSLLPPENAVGNYVKVVQRVPVKIVFDKPIDEPALDIAPGMSVVPKVRVE